MTDPTKRAPKPNDREAPRPVATPHDGAHVGSADVDEQKDFLDAARRAMSTHHETFRKLAES